MYPGTQANIYERLLPKTVVSTADNAALPMFLCMFSSDKGTEDLTLYTADDFKKMYGSAPNFKKYGQPSNQVYKILNAGGRVLGKRIVAADSTLGNVIVKAKVEAKTKEEGSTTYNYAAVTIKVDSKVGATSVDSIETTLDAETFTDEFPLFIITDNGRGVSNKKVRIAADYSSSRSTTYGVYKLSDLEDNSYIETVKFAIDEDAVSTASGVATSMVLTPSSTVQVKAKTYQRGLDAYLAALVTATGLTKAELLNTDCIFGKTLVGGTLKEIETSFDTGAVINSETGIPFAQASNGNFGDSPWAATSTIQLWGTEAVNFLKGEYTDAIFDTDLYNLDFVVDANYPWAESDATYNVKSQIVTLVNFREDAFYFRDMNLACGTLESIQTLVAKSAWTKSKFVGDYSTFYDVIDSTSGKQIKVTMLHGLAPLLVDYYENHIGAPIAGEFNNAVITEAVKGTVSFIPRITPSVNQKETMDDLHVNYCNYSQSGALVVQSSYTSQTTDGPLIHTGNVIVTQRLIKEIRRYCPKIRFMQTEDPDFEEYKNLITDNVISVYKKFFYDVQLVYTANDEQINNKQFYASIYCWYKNYANCEVFDVFAMEGTPDTNPAS